jgi:hypothetical protein
MMCYKTFLCFDLFRECDVNCFRNYIGLRFQFLGVVFLLWEKIQDSLKIIYRKDEWIVLYCDETT